MKVIEQIVRLTINGDETKAEVVGELTRCEKCKRWKEDFDDSNYGYCYLDYGSPRTTDASDYCSWWEKKVDGKGTEDENV